LPLSPSDAPVFPPSPHFRQEMIPLRIGEVPSPLFMYPHLPFFPPFSRLSKSPRVLPPPPPPPITNRSAPDGAGRSGFPLPTLLPFFFSALSIFAGFSFFFFFHFTSLLEEDCPLFFRRPPCFETIALRLLCFHPFFIMRRRPSGWGMPDSVFFPPFPLLTTIAGVYEMRSSPLVFSKIAEKTSFPSIAVSFRPWGFLFSGIQGLLQRAPQLSAPASGPL